MTYNRTIVLNDGRRCLLRNGTAADGEAALELFVATHSQTDYLLSYPDEITMTPDEEGAYLRKKTDSKNEIEILAFVDSKVVGIAGIEQVSPKQKLRHRCDFGVCVDRDHWRLGIGRALTAACIECAAEAGYEQIELEAVSENAGAIELYKQLGFVEYGRNPRDFRSRLTGYQEVVYMRKELTP